MALIKSVTDNQIDTSAISSGCCVRAKRTGWMDWRNGFVTEVVPDHVTVLYSTGAGNAVNYFDVPADEVAAGLWQMYWTADFVTVQQQGVTGDA